MSGERSKDRSGDRPHLSIGEVLSLLQDDFPDITISKIRFLESQGLLDPERTPSGYRRFYDHDLARLRWILTQQRDHFLPLRVIKERLDAGVVPDGIAPPPSIAPSTPPSTGSPSTGSPSTGSPSTAPQPTAPQPTAPRPIASQPTAVPPAPVESGASAGSSTASIAAAGTGAASGRLAPVGGGPARVVGGSTSGDARRADGDDEGARGDEAPVEPGATDASPSGPRGSDAGSSRPLRGQPTARSVAASADVDAGTDHIGNGPAAVADPQDAIAAGPGARGGAGRHGEGDEAAGPRQAGPRDAGSRDAGSRDAASRDAGSRDAGSRDAGRRVAGRRAAGPGRRSASGSEPPEGRRSTWSGPAGDRSGAAAQPPAAPGASEPGPAEDAAETAPEIAPGTAPETAPGTGTGPGARPVAPAARGGERDGGDEGAESRRRRQADVTALSMSLTELAAACGQSVADLHELERFGLISGEHVGSSVVYRDDALLVARLAARFGRHGIEPRHLRQYRVAAEREVALVEQVIAPFLLSRGRAGAAGEAATSGRRSAFEAADELAGLGEELRQVLVERGLRSYLDGV